MLRRTLIFTLLLSSVKGWTSETNQSTVQKHDELPTPKCLYESRQADVYIMNAGNPSEDGLVKLKLPFSPELFTICYPAKQSYDSNRKLAILAHLACRHLGYMTYEHSTLRKQTFPTGIELHSVQGNMRCKGNEQSLDYCAWCNATVDRCSDVLSTQCSSCHYVLEAPEGYIMSPGYPYAYLHTVQCEWEIIVPEDNNILLTLRQFLLPRNRWAPVLCQYEQAHVEVIYGSPGALSIHRFCSVNYGETIKVPYRKAKVRFQSGIYSSNMDFSGANYGFNILFKGEPIEPSMFQSFKILVIAVVLVIAFVMSVLYYCCRKRRPRRKNRNYSRADSVIQNALRAAPQRRVSIYIRPDTEQSKTDRKVLFMPPQSAQTKSKSSRQKTQVYDSSESSFSNTELIQTHGAELVTYHPTATASYPTPHIPRKEILNPGDRNRMAKLKATLFSRFSSSARSSIRSLAKNGIAPVVRPQVTNICNSFESTYIESQSASRDSTRRLPTIKPRCVVTPSSDAPSQERTLQDPTATKPRVIPTIVVECVDDSSELYECPKFADGPSELNQSPKFADGPSELNKSPKFADGPSELNEGPKFADGPSELNEGPKFADGPSELNEGPKFSGGPSELNESSKFTGDSSECPKPAEYIKLNT